MRALNQSPDIKRVFNESDVQKYFSFVGAKIRLAKPGDCLEVVKLVNEAFSYHDERRGRKRMTATEFEEWRNNDVMLVVEKSGRVAATINVWFDQESRPHFKLLSVVESERGKGLARAILNTLEARSKEAGFERVALGIMGVAPAWLMPYYERLGYKLTGRVVTWDNIEISDMEKRV